MKTFVVAGTHEQAQNWIRKNITDVANNYGEWRSFGDYVIVNSEVNLKGFSNPHGVFVGSWRERKDLKPLLLQLHMQSNPANPKILDLMREVGL